MWFSYIYHVTKPKMKMSDEQRLLGLSSAKKAKFKAMFAGSTAKWQAGSVLSIKENGVIKDFIIIEDSSTNEVTTCSGIIDTTAVELV